ncbi:two-component system, sensor histidine kinase and response regulator [Gammaproteobacteria bacterium]
MQSITGYFNGLTVFRRMLGFTAIAVLSILIIGLSMFLQLEKMRKINENFHFNAYIPNDSIKEMKYKVFYVRRVLRDANQEQNKALRENILQQLAIHDGDFFNDIRKLQSSSLSDSQLLMDIDILYRKLVFYRSGVIDKIRTGNQNEVWEMTADDYASNPSALLLSNLDRLSTIISKNAIALEKASRSLYKDEQLIFIIIITTFLLLIIVGAALFTKSITQPLRDLRDHIIKLSQGQLDVVIPYQNQRNEIGEIARRVTVLQEFYQKLEEQRWIKSNIAILSALCQRARTTAELGKELLSNISPLLGAGQGLFFIVNKNPRTPVKIASYGDADQTTSPNVAGARLVTQCILDKKPLSITAPIPEDYFRIGSGLGESTPKAIQIYPVMIADQVLGVIELATFHTFNNNQLALLDALIPIVAMSLEIINHDEQNKILLKTTQIQTIELVRFRRYIEKSRDGIYVAEAQTGRIVDATPSAWLSLGYSRDELLQKYVWDVEAMLPSLEEWRLHVATLRQCGEITNQGLFMRKDGSRFPTEVKIGLIVDSGTEYIIGTARDMTERKQAEIALAALEERSRLILSSVEDGIIGIDNKNNTVFINPAASSLLGYTDEELLNHPLHAMVHYANLNGSEHAIETCHVYQTGQDGIPRKVKNDILWKKDGTPIPVEYATTPMYKANELMGSVMVFRDISQRQQAEAELAALEEYSRLILSSVREGIIYMDTDGQITFANPAALALLSYTSEELIHQPMHAKLHHTYLDGSEFPIEQCPMLQTTQDGQPRTVDSEVLWDKNGQSIPVEYITTPVYGEEKIIGVVMVFRDITERKRAEAAIRDAHEQQQAIFESATIGISFIKDRIFQKCNRKCCELFGYDQNELIGRTTRCLYPDEQSNREVDLAYAELNNGGIYQRIQQILRKDGSTFWCHMSGSAIAVGDPSRGSVWTFSDVTKEREAVESLRQAKEIAESATKMKSDFLANMSHEIRTPMNAIIGLSHLLLKTELTPRQQGYLKKIQGSSQHLLGILNDILDLSKIEAGKLTIDKTEFKLEKVLENVASLLIEKSSAKGLELLFNIDPAVPEYLIGDPLRLGQILINYTSNAVKFTEQGEIDLRVRIIEETDQEVLIHFSVRDTGIGLTEEQKSQLFQNFSQVDQSATRRFSGTGLGLAISRKLAELMDGEVGVDSVHGQGSTFWFTARFGRGSAHSSTPRLLPPKTQGRRILIVDDNDQARMIFTEMLTNMAFAVDAVASGQEAVEAVRRSASNQPYDLVSIDWWMPEMDGIETARQICALELAAKPHIIMVTANGKEEVFKQARDTGIEEVLIKPVSASALFNTTMRVLGIPSLSEQESSFPSLQEVTAELAIRQGARILLVEDNELNQEVAMALLSEAGFVVDLAVNGELAVQQVQQANYDLVLMDMQMPIMDGITATLEINRLPSFIPPPIVAMTANAMRQDREQCREAGMVDHVAKPIDPEELWRILLKWIKPRAPAKSKPEAKLGVTVTNTLPTKIHGLDMMAGLRRVLNKQSLYLSMLRKFLKTQKIAPAAITAALDADDWETTGRLAHTLKGVAGGIEARELQTEAARLEAIIKEKQQRTIIDEQLAAVATCLTPLITDLETKLLPEATVESGMVFDVNQVREVCAKIADRLINDDFGVNKILTDNADLLQTAFGNDYREIEENIQHFDFDNALRALTQAAEKINIFKRRKYIDR